MKSLSLLFVGVVCACGVASAQAPTPAPSPVPPTSPTPVPPPFPTEPAPARKLPRIGVNVSSFFPTSSKTRRTFGSSWTSIGLGLGSTLIAKARVFPDFNLIRQKEDDDRAFAITAGARYVRPIGKTIDPANPPSIAPYAGVGLNLIYAKIDAPSNNTDDKGIGIGANASLGTTLGRTFFVEGRYSLFTETADFNLSGAQLVVGARF